MKKSPLLLLWIFLLISGIFLLINLFLPNKWKNSSWETRVTATWTINNQIIPETQLTNPASEYCIQQGGQLIQTTLPEGEEYQNCKLPSGEEIEERKLYRAAPYLGKTLEEAQNLAKENKVIFRLLEQEGTILETTADYTPGRINAIIQNGKVISAFEE